MGNHRILLIGGGGHGRSVLDCLLRSDTYDEIGIIERQDYHGESLFGIPIIGSDDDFPQLFRNGWNNAVIAMGSVGYSGNRRQMFRRLREIGFAQPAVVDPSAVIGQDVSLRDGVFIGKQSVVNCMTAIGECAIINTGAIIEHDCSIGSFVHISPGAILCGGVSVGEDTHIGAGAIIRQQIQIGQHSVIGVGSVVVQNIPEGVEAYGNPCRVVKHL